MKIGSRGAYGILALEELVRLWEAKTPIQVKEIAQRKAIPEEFLGQIMISLKQANIVHASRGPGGGYFLVRAPAEISLRELIQALSAAFTSPEESLQKYSADSIAARRVLEAWAKAFEAMEEVLNGITLADICEPEARTPMYYI